MSSLSDQYNRVFINGSDEEFKLVSAHFVEEIDGDFTLTVNTITNDPNSAETDLLTKKLRVDIAYPDARQGHPGFLHVPPHQVTERFLSGVIVEIRRGDEVSDPGLPFYDPTGGAQYFVQFTAKPDFELTKYTTKSNAYSEMGPIDIVERVLSDNSIAINKAVDTGNDPRPHILQYQESNYDFCRRMLQKSGASYYFIHEDSQTEFNVFTKAPSTVSTGISIRPFEDSLFRNFSWRQTPITETYSVRDWDVSKHSHKAESETSASESNAVIASINNIYPSGVPHKIASKFLADAIRDADLSDSMEITAEIGAPSVCVGEVYEFFDSADEFLNDKFIVSRVEFSLASDVATNFVGEVTLRKHAIGIAPQQTMPHPNVPGLLSAVVVAPSEDDGAESIYDPGCLTGRVKVRYTFNNITESFWARVSQAWAGNDYGTWFTPRVGHEVLVGFLHDDPDMPIVMGSLYNGKNKLAYQQEIGDQVSYIKTKSNDGYNELFFRDKKDEELIRTKAHLDMVTEVGRHHSIHVMNDYSVTAGKDLNKKPDMAAGDPASGAEGNMDFFAQKDIVMEAGENMKITVGKKMEVEVGDEVKITVGNSILTMKKDGTVDIDCKDATLKASGEVEVKASKSIKMESGQETEFTTKGDFKVDSKAKMDFKSTGDASVKSGNNLDVESGNNLGIDAGLNADLKAGAKLDVTSAAPLSIKGATVKIN